MCEGQGKVLALCFASLPVFLFLNSLSLVSVVPLVRSNPCSRNAVSENFADIALAFFFIFIFFITIIFCEEGKKKSRSLTVHVACALASFVDGGAGPGKRLAPASDAFSMDYPIFLFSLLLPFFVTQSGSDAATCHWPCSSQLGRRKRIKNPISPAHGHDKKIYRFLYICVCVCIYTCINI